MYRNQGHHKGTTSYLLDVQSNHLEGLNTRVVIPLRRPDTFPKVPLPKDLVPLFVIEGTECFLDTPRLAAIPLTELKNEMTSLAIYQSEISTALDRLRRRNALKMWTGWPTFPMVFVKGVLVGGASDLQRVIANCELSAMLNG